MRKAVLAVLALLVGFVVWAMTSRCFVRFLNSMASRS